MVDLVRKVAYFIVCIVLLHCTWTSCGANCDPIIQNNNALHQGQPYAEVHKILKEVVQHSGNENQNLQSDPDTEDIANTGDNPNTKQTTGDIKEIQEGAQTNGVQGEPTQSEKSTVYSPKVEDCPSDSKTTTTDTSTQQAVIEKQEVGQNRQDGSVADPGESSEGKSDSEDPVVGGSVAEGDCSGTEGGTESDLKTEESKQVDDGEDKGQEVGNKEETGGVLEPVVSDTENLNPQDPSVVIGDEPESGVGVASPPTVTAPDGRDYMAPEEEQGEPEVHDDTVELPPTEVETDKKKETGDTTGDTSGDTTEEAEVEVIDASDDMLSFQEWKDKKLQELALEEKAKILEGSQTQNGDSRLKSKSHKNRANYAAVSCGGKIQTTNAEAKNVGFILTENKDQYMIQPCNAKKWFVVELCEPVKLEDIELGNLELFSSLPETFLVSVSDRYPTKEWKILGTFKAREERAVQSFHIGDSMYAKYLKVEMLTHYGKEHYCPLTILRVHGITLHDDDTEEDSHHEVMEDTVTGAEEVDTPTLFNSAKDTVISLVKTVLNGDSQAKDKQAANPDAPVDVIETEVTNVTVDSDTKDTGVVDPCPPDVRIDEDKSDSSEDAVVSYAPDQPEVPRVDDTCTHSPTTSTSPTPPPLVRLVERPEEPLSLQLHRCDYCEKDTHTHLCMWDKYTLCGYYRVCRFVYPTCCCCAGVGEKNNHPAKGSSTSQMVTTDSSSNGDSSDSGLDKRTTTESETEDKSALKTDQNEKLRQKTGKDDETRCKEISSEDRDKKEEGSCGTEGSEGGGQSGTMTTPDDSVQDAGDGDNKAVLLGDNKQDVNDDVIHTAPGSDGDGQQELDTKDESGGVSSDSVKTPTQTLVQESSTTTVQDTTQPTQSPGSTRTEASGVTATATVKMDKTLTKPNGKPSMLGPDLVEIWPSDKEANQGDVGSTGKKDHTDVVEQVDAEEGRGTDDTDKEKGGSDTSGTDTDQLGDGTKNISESSSEKNGGKELEGGKKVETSDSGHGSSEQEVNDRHGGNGQADGETDGVVTMETTTQTPPASEAEKIIYANVQSTDEQDQMQDHVVSPSDEEMPGQKYRSIQKETMYMKLKNKLKELEVNLTLSSRYLEELSVKYRQRMEEMYKSLNKTIQKLTNTSRTAELRDQKQQDRISFLEKKMENLTDHMTSLIASIDGIHHEVIERHLYILLIECCIFVAVIGWCLTKQKHHYKERIRTVSNSYFNMATKNNPLIMTPAKGHRRGNSVDISTPLKQNGCDVRGQTSGVEEVDGLKKSGSANDIAIIEPALPFFVCSNPDKKKKKKYKTSQSQGATIAPNTGYIKPSQLISHKLLDHTSSSSFATNKSQPQLSNGSHNNPEKSLSNCPLIGGSTTGSSISKVRNAATGQELTQLKPANGVIKNKFSNYTTENVFTVLQVESPPRSGPKYSVEVACSVAAAAPSVSTRKRLESQFNGSGGAAENGFDLNGHSEKDGDLWFSDGKNVGKEKRKGSGGNVGGNVGKSSKEKEKGLITDLSHQKRKTEHWVKRKR